MKRQQFIYFIEPARPEMPTSATEEEMAQVGMHFNYLKEQLESGNLVLAGRTMEPPFVGIAIFEAEDAEAADRFARSDPGIASGVFKLTRVQPYSVALIRT
jgi:uncharacterized protein YciI